jgi:hypothetical protein
MTLWRPIEIDGVHYHLTHLHPITVVYTQPPKKDHPERTYTVDVIFGLHCFTKGINNGSAVDPRLCYSDARETRIFDLNRFELSKRLPELVAKLHATKCYHTNHGNFFTIEIIENGGEKQQYEVYFTLSRSAKKGHLTLWVQSAYIRDREHQTKNKKKSIGLFVLLFNTQNNRPIKPSP